MNILVEIEQSSNFYNNGPFFHCGGAVLNICSPSIDLEIFLKNIPLCTMVTQVAK